MANMSHIRFENTLRDLQDCYYNFEDDSLSRSETRKRKELFELCKTIVEEFEYIFEEENESCEDLDFEE